MVLELLLSWSGKELHPACGNSTCCPDEEEEDIAASQNPLAIAVAQHEKSIRNRPYNANPSGEVFFVGVNFVFLAKVPMIQRYI